MVLDGFRRDQSCVKSGGAWGCLAIQFCSLWTENNKPMIIRLAIQWQFLGKTNNCTAMEKQGGGQVGAASPLFSSRTYGHSVWDMLLQPIKIPPPLNNISLGFASFFLLEGVFFWTHILSLLCYNWRPPLFVCPLWQWGPRWSLLRLSSALPWQAQAPRQMGRPGKACRAQEASGEVRSMRCVEVGAKSIWSSILTDWRQPEKETIPQIMQDKLRFYTALSDINSEACN